MATLPQSVTTCSYFINCEVANSSRPKNSSRVLCRNRITNCLGEQKPVYGQFRPHFRNTLLRNSSFEANATPQVSIESFQQIFSTSKVEESDQVLKYMFRTEVGGLVSVIVREKNLNYIVRIEVSALDLPDIDGRLVLNWAIYRGDSSIYLAVTPETLASDDGTLEASFTESSLGRSFVELEFEGKQTPCYLSFKLRSLVNSDSSVVEIRSHRLTNFCVPVGFGSGYPTPFGVSFSHDGFMNFSIFSRNAESVVLCLYDDVAANNPVLELDLDPYVNRTGDLWHVSLKSAQTLVCYGYRIKGTNRNRNKDNLEDALVLLDPYSKVILNSASTSCKKYLGSVNKEPFFDWDDDVKPNLPMDKLMLYRLNVKRFTEHKSSQLPPDIAGTFSGLNEKLEHLKYLGVNAILLEPIYPFDEQKGPFFPHHFFSPMNLYGPSGGSTSAITSMKEMIKKMHVNGIEVLLEVVFTHTSETGALKGIDDSSYYLNGVQGLEDRAALNCNFPVVQQFILDSLRHWVTEFHVDGFCFINAFSLLRGTDGKYLSRPPLVEAIAFDPLLSKTKIIADCWDPHGMVSTETRFPHWKRWAEINTSFCTDVRKFLRGEGVLSNLATRLSGSGDGFSAGRGPGFSFNFITRHSGLPLVDLVSFSGEAVSSELSWNCGEEGPTNKIPVLERRIKQIRNFLFVLYVSLGTPVLNMGDECGQSTGGSPSFDARKPYDWNALKTSFGIQVTQFISFLSSLRIRRSDLLQKKTFWKEENIKWHGNDNLPPRWEDPSCRFLAMRLRVDEEEVGDETEPNTLCIEGDLFMAFNSGDSSESVVVPQPEEGVIWRRLVDTALPYPGFFSTDGEPLIEVVEGTLTYEMKQLSCILLEAGLELE